MERNNDFQKTFVPARKWTALATGSETTRQDKLYQDIYGSASNGHSTNGVSSHLHTASRKRHSDDASDRAYDAKRKRTIDEEPHDAQLPRKKIFASTKASVAKASTSANVPRRIPLSTPVNESTAAELLERQEEGVRRQLERVGEKLVMLITNRRYDDDDSFFTIRDRRIQSNLYYDVQYQGGAPKFYGRKKADRPESQEITQEEEIPGNSCKAGGRRCFLILGTSLDHAMLL